MKVYKPENYNSLSPYLIADEAGELATLLKAVFNASELRRYEHANGKIAHLELKIDDSVLMISNSTDTYPATTTILHLYVPDVFKTFETALQHGCKSIEKPVNRPGDPDTRGSFYDSAGNHWSVSTQGNLTEE